MLWHGKSASHFLLTKMQTQGLTSQNYYQQVLNAFIMYDLVLGTLCRVHPILLKVSIALWFDLMRVCPFCRIGTKQKEEWWDHKIFNVWYCWRRSGFLSVGCHNRPWGIQVPRKEELWAVRKELQKIWGCKLLWTPMHYKICFAALCNHVCLVDTRTDWNIVWCCRIQSTGTILPFLQWALPMLGARNLSGFLMLLSTVPLNWFGSKLIIEV